MPESKFKKMWNVVIIVLLMYTACFVPYKTSFLDDDPQALFIWELIVDSLFILDMFVNFLSAFEDVDTGITEVRMKKIVKAYAFSWFPLDIAACIPFQLIGRNDKSQTSSVKLIRLARLPRLYRLLRILRMFKMVRLLKYNRTFKKYLDTM
jgi:hypothetical protein